MQNKPQAKAQTKTQASKPQAKGQQAAQAKGSSQQQQKPQGGKC